MREIQERELHMRPCTPGCMRYVLRSSNRPALPIDKIHTRRVALDKIGQGSAGPVKVRSRLLDISRLADPRDDRVGNTLKISGVLVSKPREHPDALDADGQLHRANPSNPQACFEMQKDCKL